MAARLARVAGLYHPLDWVRVYESHTAYEWTVQRILAMVDPWGDARADVRHAVNTAAIVSSQQVERDEDDAAQLIDGLRKYLNVHNPEKFNEEDQSTLDAIAETMYMRLQNEGS